MNSSKIMRALDCLDEVLSNTNKMMSLTGHSYVALGYIFNAPWLVAFGILVIFIQSDYGDMLLDITLSVVSEIFSKITNFHR